MVATRLCLAASLVFAAACASRPPVDVEPGGVVAGPRPKAMANVISRAELTDPIVNGMDALRAIRQLRPAFFRTSGPQSFSNGAAGDVLMSQDYGPLQPVSQLVMFNTLNIAEVRYLGINEAANRFGINANGGPVIVVLFNKE